MSPGHGPLLSPTLTAATLPSLLRSAFAEPPRSPGAAPLPYSRSLSVRTSMSPPHSPHDSDNEEPPSPLAAAHGQQFMLPHAATFVRFLDQDTQSGSAQQRKKQYRNSADAAALMQDLHRMHLVPPLGASGAERHSVSVPASPMISATTSLSLGASPISKGLTSPQMVPAQVPASPSRLSAYGVAMSSESGENLLPIAAMSSLHSSSVSSSSSSSSSSSPSSSSSSSSSASSSSCSASSSPSTSSLSASMLCSAAANHIASADAAAGSFSSPPRGVTRDAAEGGSTAEGTHSTMLSFSPPADQSDESLSSRGEPKGPPDACLFVASLSADTTEVTLRAFYEQYGPVLKQKLLKDKMSRAYAFVQFASTEDADRALSDSHGRVLDGRAVRVERAKVNRTLFIARFSRELSEADVHAHCSAYGPVESVTFIKHHQTQQSKGCGFVKYAFREDALDAIAGLKASDLGWVVEWATNHHENTAVGVDRRNVFVGGLNPRLATEALLVERFAPYGGLENVSFINHLTDPANTAPDDPRATRSAYAFLRFGNEESAAVAIEHENGKEFCERVLRVQYCESSETKQKRRHQQRGQHQMQQGMLDDVTVLGGGGGGMPSGGSPSHIPPQYLMHTGAAPSIGPGGYPLMHHPHAQYAAPLHHPLAHHPSAPPTTYPMHVPMSVYAAGGYAPPGALAPHTMYATHPLASYVPSHVPMPTGPYTQPNSYAHMYAPTSPHLQQHPGSPQQQHAQQQAPQPPHSPQQQHAHLQHLQQQQQQQQHHDMAQHHHEMAQHQHYMHQQQHLAHYTSASIAGDVTTSPAATEQ